MDTRVTKTTPVGELAKVREELWVTEMLLAQRQQVLAAIGAISPCPVHGPNCVPNALKWIEEHKDK